MIGKDKNNFLRHRRITYFCNQDELYRKNRTLLHFLYVHTLIIIVLTPMKILSKRLTKKLSL